MTNPCEASCPKCGNADIALTFHSAGDVIEGIGTLRYGECPIKKANGLVSGGGHYWKAASELIAYICRKCEFSWASKPMKKPRKKAVNTGESQ